MSEYIPIVDFARCSLDISDESDVEQDALREAGNQLYKTFNISGFAYLSNHGIPDDYIREYKDTMEKFFTSSDEVKMKYCSENHDFCYDPIGSVRVSHKRGYDLHEGFRMTGKGLEDRNTVWPEYPSDLKDKSLHLANVCKELSLRLMKALGFGLKLKDPLFLWKCHSLLNKKGNSTTLKLVRYPAILSDDTLKENQLRVGEHTDWLCLTLLFQDENGGLQTANPSGEFVDVPPIPGTIVLNIADCLQYWSGGRLKSSVHRVVSPPDPKKQRNVRRSVVYFISADDHVPIREMEFEDGADPHSIEFNADEEKVFTVEDYYNKRFKDIFTY